MHLLFRLLGLLTALYLALALSRGEIYARSGPWGRTFSRAAEPRGYWSAIGAYAALSAALLFAF